MDRASRRRLATPVTASAAGSAGGSAAEPDTHIEAAPHYYGGQAVIEGVMMRGADTGAKPPA